MAQDDAGIQPPTPPAGNQPAEAATMLTSEQLLAGQREVLIRHAGEVYRLRLTRSGKLILQK